MALYGFYIEADIRPNQGLKEEELALATAERIIDVVEPHAFEGKVTGIRVVKINHVLAMTLPMVTPLRAQDVIRYRKELERRQASPVSEIDHG